jgi:hypothetical protein
LWYSSEAVDLALVAVEREREREELPVAAVVGRARACPERRELADA